MKFGAGALVGLSYSAYWEGPVPEKSFLDRAAEYTYQELERLGADSWEDDQSS